MLATSEILVAHAVINALFAKNTKSDSKRSIVNKPLSIPFDFSAELTQIMYDLPF